MCRRATVSPHARSRARVLSRLVRDQIDCVVSLVGARQNQSTAKCTMEICTAHFLGTNPLLTRSPKTGQRNVARGSVTAHDRSFHSENFAARPRGYGGTTHVGVARSARPTWASRAVGMTAVSRPAGARARVSRPSACVRVLTIDRASTLLLPPPSFDPPDGDLAVTRMDGRDASLPPAMRPPTRLTAPTRTRTLRSEDQRNEESRAPARAVGRSRSAMKSP